MLVAPNMAVLAQLLVAFAAPDSAFDVVRFKDRVGSAPRDRVPLQSVRLAVRESALCFVSLFRRSLSLSLSLSSRARETCEAQSVRPLSLSLSDETLREISPARLRDVRVHQATRRRPGGATRT